MVQEQITNHAILNQITSEIFIFDFLWKPLGCAFSTYLPKPQELGNLYFVSQVKAEMIMYRHELGAQTAEGMPNILRSHYWELKNSLLLVLLFLKYSHNQSIGLSDVGWINPNTRVFGWALIGDTMKSRLRAATMDSTVSWLINISLAPAQFFSSTNAASFVLVWIAPLFPSFDLQLCQKGFKTSFVWGHTYFERLLDSFALWALWCMEISVQQCQKQRWTPPWTSRCKKCHSGP